MASLNKLVMTIPWMFFTGIANVHKREFYDAPEGQQVAPQVSFGTDAPAPPLRPRRRLRRAAPAPAPAAPAPAAPAPAAPAAPAPAAPAAPPATPPATPPAPPADPPAGGTPPPTA